VTASTTIVDNALTAQNEIDRVFDTTLASSRPGYIELCRDMVNVEIDIKANPTTAQAINPQHTGCHLDFGQSHFPRNPS
jgi:TPP-dependent 2-oxoacid decarboxylase